MKRKITILGAGLVGTALSVLLRKKGYEVVIYERRPDMRNADISAGRSINLAISHRGWKTLEMLDAKEQIERLAIPMPGRFLHQSDGTSTFQSYGKNGEAIYSVSRGELNKTLMNIAEATGVRIHFNRKCINVNVLNNLIHLQDENGQYETVKCDLLFGADGAFSSLRTSMSFMDRVNFEQMYIEHGYKELSIPPGANNTWLIDKNALHIWPRKNYMMIALPNTDGNFTCTLFFPFEGNPSFDSIKSRSEIMEFFNENFPDAVSLMPTLVEDFQKNPISSLVTTRIFPWSYKNLSCLIGDAAHAVVPFYGQGLNAGLEDCTVLSELIDEYGDDWSKIFSVFEELRKANADAVADLALLNFVEMRDKVADPKFLERKKIEKDLGLRFPQKFNSVYEMVSFSHSPYSEALKAIQAQDWLLEKIMQEGDYFRLIENIDFQSKIEKYMNEYENRLEM